MADVPPVERRHDDLSVWFVQTVDDFLFTLGTRKPSPHTVAAYRRDLYGVARRLAAGAGIEPSHIAVEHLSKRALRRAFASWASDHAAASVARAWSTWNALFDHLVAEDAVDGNPMPAVQKPKLPRSAPKGLSGDDAIARLLRAAASRDRQARSSWPERDLALLATFVTTGVRLAEAVGLTLGDLAGEPGDRRLTVVGKGNRARTVPITGDLEAVYARYLESRMARFPDAPTRATAPLFVSYGGDAITRGQVEYLIERLYRRAGVDKPAGASVHALRHTFATSALDVGANIVEVQQLLGHSSLETTRRYLDATAQQLREAVRAHPSQRAVREVLSDRTGTVSDSGVTRR